MCSFCSPHRALCVQLVGWGAALLMLSGRGASAHPGTLSPFLETGCAEVHPLPRTAAGLHLAFQLPPCRRMTPPPRATPAAPDRWWGRDKAQHLVVSGLWTLSAQYVLVDKAGWAEADALPLAAGSAAAAGLAKELYDTTHPDGTASEKDLVANAVGIGLAVGIIVL